MSAPQGIVTFDGVRAFLSASFSLSHGITPNVCTIRIPPQPGGLRESGTLRFAYAGQTLEFPDCKVDKADYDLDDGGYVTWSLSILDRRWKWRIGGHVSGYYNVRRGTGIVRETLKKPQELARLCLDAMGERRYDVSALPNDTYPEIEWDYTLAAEALAKLCDYSGCRIVLGLNNRVKIVKIGDGGKLPTQNALSLQASEDSPERPDKLVFVSGRLRAQVDLVLEAVAEDIDGQIKPLADLTYYPRAVAARARGTAWNFFDPGFANSIEPQKARDLAARDVYRLYRVVVPPGFGIRVPTPGDKPLLVDSLERILPIEDLQLEKVFRDSELRRKDAEVWGTFWRQDEGGRNSYGDGTRYPPLRESTKKEVVYPGQFEIDTARGLVRFADPVARLIADGTVPIEKPAAGGPRVNKRYLFKPALIYLRTTISVRYAKTRAWIRHEIERRSRQRRFGTKPEVLLHDEVEAWAYRDPATNRIVSNKRELEDAAKHYLDQRERFYNGRGDSQGATYAGLAKIDLDGAIRQVTWSINAQGFATTSAQRNQEDVLAGPTHEERRLFNAVAATLEHEARFPTARAAEERVAKGA